MGSDEANGAGGERTPVATIALCEDDAEIRNLLCAFLTTEGFAVEAVATARELDRLLGERAVDLVVLDWMLPGEDGLSVCRRLTAQGGPPVLMLTARDDDSDRIAGLETGADGYLTKPFNPRVLLAHIRAALRSPANGPARKQLQVGDIVVDPAGRRVSLGEQEIALTAGEFDLLLCLAERPQRVLSREHLMGATRGRESRLFDRTIDVQVSRLRAKLEAAGSRAGGLIRAVRNAGYILAAPAEPG